MYCRVLSRLSCFCFPFHPTQSWTEPDIYGYGWRGTREVGWIMGYIKSANLVMGFWDDGILRGFAFFFWLFWVPCFLFCLVWWSICAVGQVRSRFDLFCYLFDLLHFFEHLYPLADFCSSWFFLTKRVWVGSFIVD